MAELRLHIDGDWKAADFAAFFQSLHEYHGFVALRYRVLAFSPEGTSGEALFQLSSRAGPLKICRIKYGSKGFTDLTGLGSLMREIRELIQFLIVHFRERDDRILTREEKKIAIAQAKLELMFQLRRARTTEMLGREVEELQLSAEMSEFSDIPEIDPIAEAILERRLLDAELLDDERDQL